MGDSEEKPAPTAIPDWQRDHDNSPANDPAPEDSLDVARRFLADEEVKSASPEKKAEFLRSKGIDEADIETLLRDAQEDNTPPSTTEVAQTVASSNETATLETESKNRPPIVTYPEFLAKPTRPPPLVTTNGLLHTFNAFAALSAVLYGASKFVVGPMVENLTAARVDLHDATSTKLDGLVGKLEETVSEIPPTRSQTGPAGAIDASSDIDDPAEMFHRDIGTQTSFPSTPAVLPSKGTPNSEGDRQMDRLAALTGSLSSLKDEYRGQSEDLEDIKTLIDVFRDDLDSLTYGTQAEFVGGYDVYNRSRKSEPEDEIKKARDNIRRVKGVLLSTRNFPSSTRRG